MFKNILFNLNKNYFGYIEVLSRLMNWSVLPIVSFLVEPSLFGQVILVYSFIVFVCNVGVFGQNKTILVYGKERFFSFKYPAIIIIISSFIISILILVKYDFGFAFIVIGLLSSFSMGLSYLYRVKNNVGSFAILRLIQTLLRLLLVSSFLIFDKTIESYLLGELISLLLTLVLLKLYVFFYNFENKDKVNIEFSTVHDSEQSNLNQFNQFKIAFFFGLPVFFHTLISNLNSIFDRLIISNWFGNEVLANYYFTMIFCSCIGFYYAFSAQRYELKIYNARNQKYSNKIVDIYFKKNIVFSLKMAIPLFFVYFCVCYFSKKYFFDFLLFIICYSFSVLTLVPICISFVATSLKRNILILYSSLLYFLMFFSLIYFFRGFSSGVYFVPFSGALSFIILYLLFNRLSMKLKAVDL